MSESTGRKMGPRELAVRAKAGRLIAEGNEASDRGDPPWWYYSAAVEADRRTKEARLADALEEALNRLAVLVGCAEIILSDGPHELDRKQIDRLRAMLAEVDRG